MRWCGGLDDGFPVALAPPCWLRGPLRSALPLPASQLLAVAVRAQVVRLGSTIEGAVLPLAAPLMLLLLLLLQLEAGVKGTPGAPPRPPLSGLARHRRRRRGSGVLVSELQPLGGVEAVGVGVRLVLAGQAEGEQPGRAVAVGRQRAVLLGVGGARLQGAHRQRRRRRRRSSGGGHVGSDVLQVDDAVPLDGRSMAVVGRHGDWTPLSTDAGGGVRRRGEGGRRRRGERRRRGSQQGGGAAPALRHRRRGFERRLLGVAVIVGVASGRGGKGGGVPTWL